jgi:tetratricopeptide (TPR) repeat protein
MRKFTILLTSLLLIGSARPQSGPPDFLKQAKDFIDKGDYAHAIEAYSNALRLDPRSDKLLYARGYAYYRNHDDDHAIQDYTEALKLNAAFGEAYRERARAYEDKMDYEHAIQDYTEAIRLLPGISDLRFRRAFTYERAGQYGPAIADFTENILRFPHAADPYRNRGRLRLYAGDIPDAQQDLSKAVELEPANYYSVIWLYIARTRGTPAGTAAAELAKNAAKLKLAKWPGPVIQLFLGKTTSRAVLRAASDEDTKTNNERQCEANFYIAEYQALHGQGSAALQGFRLVENSCPKNYFFYAPAAQAEMASKH